MKNDGKNGKNASDGKHPSPDSHSSHPIIPPRGDYQTLLSFQKAEVVYDLTFRFAHKYLAKGDRTVDQMIQSARSGKQNILEGSKAALTSKETEIKLTNVGRASLEELLDDYRDYLRVRDHAIWDKDSKEALYRPPAWPQDPADLRALPRVCGDPPAGGDRQHRHLPDSPDQLPDRPATPPAGAGFSGTGRPARAHDSSARLAYRNRTSRKK